MGYWCTLHLFDDSKFYQETVPELKGEKGDLTDVCLGFLKSHVIGGISHLTPHEIDKLVRNYTESVISISKCFDKTFKIHSEFQKSQNQRDFLNNLTNYYDFCKFLEYYLFKNNADFFPHLPLGKGGVSRNFNLNVKTASFSIITELDAWNEFLCSDGMGITNWITNDYIELLYLDKENLRFEDNNRAEGFLTLLEVAYKNKLGFVMGVDMREDRLNLLPGNKLVGIDVWLDRKTDGLLFKF